MKNQKPHKQPANVENAVESELQRTKLDPFISDLCGRSDSDVFSKSKRSAIMSRIRGSGNQSTELRMIALFRSNGITGWRRNHPLFGKPDFVFRRERVAVFVDGDFWHGHPKTFKYPKNNTLVQNREILRG
jgi:DNA mismatch endonuclease Vsr